MFTTENVCAYLKSVSLETDDDKRVAKLRLFITPITHELALEVSPLIADRLFRQNGDQFSPALEMDGPKFIMQFDEQSMTYKRHPEYVGHEVIVPHVSISAITAQKVIPGDPNFSLIFTASFEILDKTVIADLIDLMREKIYLTFAPMQKGLFDDHAGPEMQLACRLCGEIAPEFATDDKKFAYCKKCSSNTQDGERLIRIRPDVVAATAIAESMQVSAGEPRADPLVETGEFINSRNRGKRRTRAAVN